MDWHPQSPDRNPVENICTDIKQHLQNREIHGKHNLWLSVQQIWNKYPTDYFTKFPHT
jgi:hypothetical protein